MNRSIESIQEQIQREIEEEKKHEQLIRTKTLNDIKEIRIHSDMLCFGPEPEIGTEIEQQLYISKKGKVKLKHIYYNKKESKIDTWNIEEETTLLIFKKVLEDFLEFKESICTDCGSWSIKVYFFNGPIMKRACSMGIEPKGFSDFLRDTLNNKSIVACNE